MQWTLQQPLFDSVAMHGMTVLADSELSGVFLWQFADCRICDEWFTSRPRSYNNKGVVDEFRRPKMSYAVVKELFQW